MVKKKKKVRQPRGRLVACECDGLLRPAVLKSYDCSGIIGFPVTLWNVPGFKCSKCQGQTIGGDIINRVISLSAVEITRRPRRLSANESRLLRRIIGITQQELATRMGLVRETVAKWECGDQEISPQHDLILRVFVLTEITRKGFIPPKFLEDLMAVLTSVKVAPPAETTPLDMANVDFSGQQATWRPARAAAG